ncbi:hypothetical protein Fmac_022343 [Flemingia macrophylla]|uniref:Uncharacterized protein n=1 Tax=Flemingia macrophylla TaxID=520843 RepID=A0ABD1LZG1_9FABA
MKPVVKYDPCYSNKLMKLMCFHKVFFKILQNALFLYNHLKRLEQLKEPIKAWQVLSENPNCFICSSESMNVGSPMPPVTPNQELELGHIYFVMPLIPKSRLPLSLQDLGA